MTTATKIAMETCPRCDGTREEPGAPVDLTAGMALCNLCGGRGAVDEWTAAVNRPGKFEGERRYVPYYWRIYLDGCADRDNGRILGFDVTDEDKAIFPELRRRRAISLRETDSGFVVEV